MRLKPVPFHFNVHSLFLVLFISGIAGFGQTASNANPHVIGSLIMNDGSTKKEIPFKHAYATYVLPDTLIEIALSDKPLPEQYEERATYINVLRKEGRFNGLVLKVRNEKIEQSQAYSEISKNPQRDNRLGGLWYASKRKQVFELTSMEKGVLSATISSSVLADESGIGKRGSYEYSATFKVPVAETLALYETEKNDKPAESYMAFYKAVEAGGLEEARKLIAADYAAAYQGAKAEAKLSKLKPLIKSFSRVVQIQVYKGGKSAKILVENPAYEEELKKWEESSSRSPDKRPVRLAEVRAVVEDGRWKIYWVLDTEQYNMLSGDYLPLYERLN
ncbi:MAG: hypothetical protein L0229_10145 [Blastocatellia bacterium]|nr:hypothetical protein [Blastocatellia bacterium]